MTGELTHSLFSSITHFRSTSLAREDSGDGYAWYRPRPAVGLMTFDLSRYDPSKLLFRPAGEVSDWYWRASSNQTEVIAYDLSDPLHPARRGSTLEAIDLSGDRFDVRSKTKLGTYGAQLMGLRAERLFVNLPGAGVVVVDTKKLDAPKPVHFVPTFGYATHVAIGDDRAYIAAGAYGIFEVPFNAPPTISNMP